MRAWERPVHSDCEAAASKLVSELRDRRFVPLLTGYLAGGWRRRRVRRVGGIPDAARLRLGAVLAPRRMGCRVDRNRLLVVRAAVQRLSAALLGDAWGVEPPSSENSPLESTQVTLTVIGNGGLIPSGNDVSGAGLSCVDFVCTGSTQADHQANPGTLELPLVFTKPGQYSLCADAALPPLSFETAVCTDKFNVRP